MAVNDTAVVVAYFEPCPSDVTANNFWRVCRSILSAGASLFTVELVRAQPGAILRSAKLAAEMPAEHCFVYTSNHLMFHKENLLNLAAKRIPQQYTKLCFVDADIIFSNLNWYTLVSANLEKYDIVQPMDWCEFLDCNDDVIRHETMVGKPPVAMLLQRNEEIRLDRYHCGFSWAFRREVFDALGGFYDRALSGSGDSAFTYAITKSNNARCLAGYKNWAPIDSQYFVAPSYMNYSTNAQRLSLTFNYVTNNTARHLFHGSTDIRGYGDARAKHLPAIVPETGEYPVYYRDDGLLEWQHEQHKQQMLPYFVRRAAI
jgi:hypothetical protein